MMIAFNGPDGVAIYRATVLASGLRLYAKTGMKPNRAWTPTAMLQAAGSITGTRYKRGQFEQAALDLKAWVDARTNNSEVPLLSALLPPVG